MPDYQNGRIYTVRCRTDNSLIYVGSTTMPLSRRFSLHKNNKYCSLYKLIQNNFNGDWSNFYIELYEEYPCNNKEILNKREGEIQREIATINKHISGRTQKEYYIDNRNDKIHYQKEYYIDNRNDRMNYQKKYNNQYYLNNRDKILEQKKKYYILKK